MSREITMRIAILVKPKPCDRIQWDDVEYHVETDTDPAYPELDFPIKLYLGGSEEKAIEFEPGDAEAVGRALIRAAEIRRIAIAAAGDKP